MDTFGLTIGTVVDTNDPQQNGRLKVYCQAWDIKTSRVKDIPWATYCSPFGGVVTRGERGPSNDPLPPNAQTAYGMWAIPKIGAKVVVGVLDNDPNRRVWMGCMYVSTTPHTMPHGRYFDTEGEVGMQEGPLDSSEQFINPLHKNHAKAFFRPDRPLGATVYNYEWSTRGSDYQVSANRSLGNDPSKVVPQKLDDSYIDTTASGGTSRQGYAESKEERYIEHPDTGENLDSQTYAITTPGFHALSMDDREENCRIRLRTTAGHQIIMDDTNERIYISTAEGNNWIELDQNGNIDVYSERRLSVHCKKDISIKSDETVRITGKKGIHLFTEKNLDMMALDDINIKSERNMTQKVKKQYHHHSQNYKFKADENINGTSGLGTSLHGGKIIHYTAEKIHFNGPVAPKVGDAIPEEARWVIREPQHEPWARSLKAYQNMSYTISLTASDNIGKAIDQARVLTGGSGSTAAAQPDKLIHPDEHQYLSEFVNRKEGSEVIPRNPNWRR